jgi:hypothetical protein
MAETFILIPGRTSRQGTALNEGKFTAAYGINTPGTVYRMDDVPIPLRPAFDSTYPSDEAVLKRIERRVWELQAGR